MIGAIDGEAMLHETCAWAAINTGTGNLGGLAEMAALLADRFAALPGEIELVEPAPVTATRTPAGPLLTNTPVMAKRDAGLANLA